MLYRWTTPPTKGDYLSGVGAEVLDDEGDDDRRAVVRVLSPRQPDARLPDVADGRLGRRSGVRGRLRRPAENDVVVGRRLDDQGGTGRRLAGLAQGLARVPAGVALPQLCTVHGRRRIPLRSNSICCLVLYFYLLSIFYLSIFLFFLA